MPGSGETDLSSLLAAVNAGEAGAMDRLCDAIYDQLRAMARRRLTQDFGDNLAGVTIQPTVLANDTLMRLIRQRQKYDNAGHLFAIASRMMLRVLMDYHRSRTAAKRGGRAVHVTLDPEAHNQAAAEQRAADSGVDVEAFDQALEKLAALDPRKADVVRYRAIWELSNPEIADALGVALATVERDWAFARAWLSRELEQSCPS